MRVDRTIRHQRSSLDKPIGDSTGAGKRGINAVRVIPIARLACSGPALWAVEEGEGSAAASAADRPAGDIQLDAERQRQAQRYARQRHVLLLVNLALGAVVVLALLLSGLAFALRDALAGAARWQPLTHWAPLQVAAYFGVLYGAYFLLDLPLSFYGGYTLPHRYGLSTQRLRGWVADLGKGLALSVVFELAAVEFVYALLAVTPNAWWLWVGGAMLLVTVVLANLGPVLLMPLFYKFTPLPDGDLKSRLLALAERAHTRVRGVYSMNLSTRTRAANAGLTGLGNTRRIVVGDTLLESFTPDEIEVVLAHELGHQVHHDIPMLIAVQTGVTLGGLFVVNLVLHAVVATVPAYHGLADVATITLLAATLGVFGLVMLPLTNGSSRWAERRADGYALETTHNVPAFISAMTRLANQNLAEAEPAPWIEFLLHDHPSTGRRIAFAHRYAAEHGSHSSVP
jgi:STE24 endopeptidase